MLCEWDRRLYSLLVYYEITGHSGREMLLELLFINIRYFSTLDLPRSGCFERVGSRKQSL